METLYCISLNIKRGSESECLGKFFLGHDKRFAESTFNKLKGSKEVDEKSILQLELRATKNELPMNLHMMSCALEELAENCRIITKEVFKMYNLEEIR